MEGSGFLHTSHYLDAVSLLDWLTKRSIKTWAWGYCVSERALCVELLAGIKIAWLHGFRSLQAKVGLTLWPPLLVPIHPASLSSNGLKISVKDVFNLGTVNFHGNWSKSVSWAIWFLQGRRLAGKESTSYALRVYWDVIGTLHCIAFRCTT